MSYVLNEHLSQLLEEEAKIQKITPSILLSNIVGKALAQTDEHTVVVRIPRQSRWYPKLIICDGGDNDVA
jgi:hypothetical protein